MASDYTYKMHLCLQIFSVLSEAVGEKPESYSLFSLKQELTVTFYTSPFEKQALKPKVLCASCDSVLVCLHNASHAMLTHSLTKSLQLKCDVSVFLLRFSICQQYSGVFAKINSPVVQSCHRLVQMLTFPSGF